jgi:hypothetical protein
MYNSTQAMADITIPHVLSPAAAPAFTTASMPRYNLIFLLAFAAIMLGGCLTVLAAP